MNFRVKTAVPDSVVVDVPQYPPVPVSNQLKKTIVSNFKVRI